MKQVLAVRVGAKKAVGHIVSKKWGPTVNGGELDEGLPSDHIKKGRKDGALPRTGLNGGERGAVP